jgi:hypothetical protein
MPELQAPDFTLPFDNIIICYLVGVRQLLEICEGGRRLMAGWEDAR